eukprot:1779216-Prymnesium_polylepis.1
MIGYAATTAAPVPSRKMAPANSCSTASGAWPHTGRAAVGAGAVRKAASSWPAAYACTASATSKRNEPIFVMCRASCCRVSR